MSEQISFSLSDEVAPYYPKSPYIATLCGLVDEKMQTGRKYNDLKEQLLKQLEKYDLNDPRECHNIYRRAYEFAKYY